jgi:hypothetical protein
LAIPQAERRALFGAPAGVCGAESGDAEQLALSPQARKLREQSRFMRNMPSFVALSPWDALEERGASNDESECDVSVVRDDELSRAVRSIAAVTRTAERARTAATGDREAAAAAPVAARGEARRPERVAVRYITSTRFPESRSPQSRSPCAAVRSIAMGVSPGDTVGAGGGATRSASALVAPPQCPALLVPRKAAATRALAAAPQPQPQPLTPRSPRTPPKAPKAARAVASALAAALAPVGTVGSTVGVRSDVHVHVHVHEDGRGVVELPTSTAAVPAAKATPRTAARLRFDAVEPIRMQSFYAAACGRAERQFAPPAPPSAPPIAPPALTVHTATLTPRLLEEVHGVMTPRTVAAAHESLAAQALTPRLLEEVHGVMTPCTVAAAEEVLATTTAAEQAAALRRCIAQVQEVAQLLRA